MSDPDSIVLFRRSLPGVSRARLERWARRLRRQVAPRASFQCLITDDAELRRLNRRFLGKDYPTDVLAFPGGEAPLPPGRKARWLGEIAISIQRARRQALRCGHSLEQEIGILMLHGLLHLLGMDHSRDEGQMKQAEARYRSKLGLPAALTERAGK